MRQRNGREAGGVGRSYFAGGLTVRATPGHLPPQIVWKREASLPDWIGSGEASGFIARKVGLQ